MNRLPPTWLASAALVATLCLAACAPMPTTAPSTGLTELLERPAERALLAGMRAYDDGQYLEADRQLRTALQAGLASPRDRASAHKYLAFIACSNQRLPDCEQAFRSALAADPAFRLSRSEAGHPVWGPVYRRVVP